MGIFEISTALILGLSALVLAGGLYKLANQNKH